MGDLRHEFPGGFLPLFLVLDMVELDPFSAHLTRVGIDRPEDNDPFFALGESWRDKGVGIAVKGFVKGHFFLVLERFSAQDVTRI